MDCTMQL